MIFVKINTILDALRDGSGANKVKFIKTTGSTSNPKNAKIGDIIHVRVISLLPKVGRKKHTIKKYRVYKARLSARKKIKTLKDNTKETVYEPFAMICNLKPLEEDY